jgi:hypothetical protein
MVSPFLRHKKSRPRWKSRPADSGVLACRVLTSCQRTPLPAASSIKEAESKAVKVLGAETGHLSLSILMQLS